MSLRCLGGREEEGWEDREAAGRELFCWVGEARGLRLGVGLGFDNACRVWSMMGCLMRNVLILLSNDGLALHILFLRASVQVPFRSTIQCVPLRC